MSAASKAMGNKAVHPTASTGSEPLTKRELIAAIVIAHLSPKVNPEPAAKQAVQYADALLEHLEASK
jgi:hypothetical protein